VVEIGVSMLNWFKGRASLPSAGSRISRAFCAEGLVLADSETDLPAVSLDPRWVESMGLKELLAQFDDEGLVFAHRGATLIPWESVFQILENPDYPGCREMLVLPADAGLVPALESHHTLTTTDFAIAVANWHDRTGARMRNVQVCGAIAKAETGLGLLSRQVWETLSHISRFQQRPDTERDDVSQRRHWGQIRRLAISAGARLDGFLFRSVVLTPEKLDIGLRNNEVCGTRVVEIIPSFQGAPPNWLDVFDARGSVPDLYNITSPDGIVQVLLSPHVKTVLENIKRLHGRRVAGARAEAFLINPYAALGEAAS
jgi:hypothetical protein